MGQRGGVPSGGMRAPPSGYNPRPGLIPEPAGGPPMAGPPQATQFNPTGSGRGFGGMMNQMAQKAKWQAAQPRRTQMLHPEPPGGPPQGRPSINQQRMRANMLRGRGRGMR